MTKNVPLSDSCVNFDPENLMCQACAQRLEYQLRACQEKKISFAFDARTGKITILDELTLTVLVKSKKVELTECNTLCG